MKNIIIGLSLVLSIGCSLPAKDVSHCNAYGQYDTVTGSPRYVYDNVCVIRANGSNERKANLVISQKEKERNLAAWNVAIKTADNAVLMNQEDLVKIEKKAADKLAWQKQLKEGAEKAAIEAEAKRIKELPLRICEAYIEKNCKSVLVSKTNCRAVLNCETHGNMTGSFTQCAHEIQCEENYKMICFGKNTSGVKVDMSNNEARCDWKE